MSITPEQHDEMEALTVRVTSLNRELQEAIRLRGKWDEDIRRLDAVMHLAEEKLHNILRASTGRPRETLWMGRLGVPPECVDRAIARGDLHRLPGEEAPTEGVNSDFGI